MKYKITLLSALVNDEMIKADDDLTFVASDENGKHSIDRLAQEIGGQMWKELYWEKPERVFYKYEIL